MSQYRPGTQPPRRRYSKKVIRRRRQVALGLLVLLILIIVVSMAQCSSGSKPEPTPTQTTAPTIAPSTETPIPQDSSTPTPGASGDPIMGDTGYAGPEATCPTKVLQVTASTDKAAYGSGQNPQLAMSVKNTSTTACKVNVGTTAQVFQISSKGKIIWQSTDCQTDGADYWALLAPGQKLSSATPVVWNRELSSPDTCSSTRPKAPAAGATYYLTTFMGPAKSAEAKAFALN